MTESYQPRHLAYESEDDKLREAIAYLKVPVGQYIDERAQCGQGNSLLAVLRIEDRLYDTVDLYGLELAEKAGSEARLALVEAMQ